MYNEKHLKNIYKALEKAELLYNSCICCGHICHVDRNKNNIGRCKIFEDTEHIKTASHTCISEKNLCLQEKAEAVRYFFQDVI